MDKINSNITNLLGYVDKAETFYRNALNNKETMKRQEKLDYHSNSLNLFANEVLDLIKSGMEHNISSEKLAKLTKYASWSF